MLPLPVEHFASVFEMCRINKDALPCLVFPFIFFWLDAFRKQKETFTQVSVSQSQTRWWIRDGVSRCSVCSARLDDSQLFTNQVQLR